MRLTLMSLVDLRFALVVCTALCGCNRTPAVPKVLTLPVTGKVTPEGNPLAGANVAFMTSDPPATFFATTKDDGAYQLQAPEDRAALLKGACKVIISRMVKPDGSPLAEGEMPALVGAVEQLPQKYSMPGMSQLKAEARGGRVLRLPAGKQMILRPPGAVRAASGDGFPSKPVQPSTAWAIFVAFR